MRGTLSFALWNSGTKYAEKQTQRGLPLRAIPQILRDLRVIRWKLFINDKSRARLWWFEGGRVERADCEVGYSHEQAELSFFFISEETLVPETLLLLWLAAGDKVPLMRNGLFLWLWATEQYMHVQLPKTPTSAALFPHPAPLPTNNTLPVHYVLVR